MVNALLGTSAGGRPEDRLGQELRFQVRFPKVPILKELKHQGTNLSGADLSRLDLRHINFKWAALLVTEENTLNVSQVRQPEGCQAIGSQPLLEPLGTG